MSCLKFFFCAPQHFYFASENFVHLQQKTTNLWMLAHGGVA
jgi:hypothetical protein